MRFPPFSTKYAIFPYNANTIELIFLFGSFFEYQDTPFIQFHALQAIL